LRTLFSSISPRRNGAKLSFQFGQSGAIGMVGQVAENLLHQAPCLLCQARALMRQVPLQIASRFQSLASPVSQKSGCVFGECLPAPGQILSQSGGVLFSVPAETLQHVLDCRLPLCPVFAQASTEPGCHLLPIVSQIG
jgi:hypothetical protein